MLVVAIRKCTCDDTCVLLDCNRESLRIRNQHHNQFDGRLVGTRTLKKQNARAIYSLVCSMDNHLKEESIGAEKKKKKTSTCAKLPKKMS